MRYRIESVAVCFWVDSSRLEFNVCVRDLFAWIEICCVEISPAFNVSDQTSPVCCAISDQCVVLQTSPACVARRRFGVLSLFSAKRCFNQFSRALLVVIIAQNQDLSGCRDVLLAFLRTGTYCVAGSCVLVVPLDSSPADSIQQLISLEPTADFIQQLISLERTADFIQQLVSLEPTADFIQQLISLEQTADCLPNALSVIPRGSWGDVARRFTMIRWLVRKCGFGVTHVARRFTMISEPRDICVEKTVLYANHDRLVLAGTISDT
ncbi:hypothetical protein F511_16334 [Dorcoceras hygrometricum]|uniref:Uncharacterized protein n=1 Tax=Dorcoceras hygrometricum TaxID=472368 RepID=A0A2Z7BX56_9LAMI|nr:hypothetical protein F511_16334 [Dorcoceras hygrometricum]